MQLFKTIQCSSITDEQCCDSSRLTAKDLSRTYTRIHSPPRATVFNLPVKAILPSSTCSIDFFEYIVLHYGSKFNKISKKCPGGKKNSPLHSHRLDMTPGPTTEAAWLVCLPGYLCYVQSGTSTFTHTVTSCALFCPF